MIASTWQDTFSHTVMLSAQCSFGPTAWQITPMPSSVKRVSAYHTASSHCLSYLVHLLFPVCIALLGFTLRGSITPLGLVNLTTCSQSSCVTVSFICLHESLKFSSDSLLYLFNSCSCCSVFVPQFPVFHYFAIVAIMDS